MSATVMAANTTGRCAKYDRADRRWRAHLRRVGALRLLLRLPHDGKKFTPTGQFCPVLMQARRRVWLICSRNLGTLSYLRATEEARRSRAVARDLISCKFSRSGCPFAPLPGKRNSDSRWQRASARVTVVRDRVTTPDSRTQLTIRDHATSRRIRLKRPRTNHLRRRWRNRRPARDRT